MNISPDPPQENPSEDATPEKGKDAVYEWAMVLFPSMVPLLTGTALWVLGMVVILSENESYTVLFVGAAVVLVGGSHLWLQSILEGRVQQPAWHFPTVLTTAMTAAVLVSVLPFFLNIESSPPLPLLCCGLSLLGAGVYSVTRWRHRFVGALTAVTAAALAIVGFLWMPVVQEQAEEREQERQEISDVPHEIAVLDSPEWEPTDISVSAPSDSVSIDYEPTEPSAPTDGFSLTLRTKTMEALEDEPWEPLYQLCDLDGGGTACEEHGDVVLADLSDGYNHTFEARTEFTEGVAGYLIGNMPKDGEGGSEAEFPDIDMVDLAGDIRPAEPGEAEDIFEDSSG